MFARYLRCVCATLARTVRCSLPVGAAGEASCSYTASIKKPYCLIAVDGVTFESTRGEIFGLLGPNGAGKTITISMLAGVLPLTDRDQVVILLGLTALQTNGQPVLRSPAAIPLIVAARA